MKKLGEALVHLETRNSHACALFQQKIVHFENSYFLGLMNVERKHRQGFKGKGTCRRKEELLTRVTERVE